MTTSTPTESKAPHTDEPKEPQAERDPNGPRVMDANGNPWTAETAKPIARGVLIPVVAATLLGVSAVATAIGLLLRRRARRQSFGGKVLALLGSEAGRSVLTGLGGLVAGVGASAVRSVVVERVKSGSATVD
ncbi:MAG: hypothetical protein U0414_06285 [Polyangiaceae bacterium]